MGKVDSCFGEKFGIPRQSGLVPESRAVIELDPRLVSEEALSGLEHYSHLWIIFIFHQAQGSVKQRVRPPRLGGIEKLGVLATRSPHRSGHIGLSLVELEKIEGLKIHIRNHDLLQGTPVLDIKPYLPYADSKANAISPWKEGADENAKRPEVHFSPLVEQQLSSEGNQESWRLKKLLKELLSLDPRPRNQRKHKKQFALQLEKWDVHWSVLSSELFLVEKLISKNAHLPLNS